MKYLLAVLMCLFAVNVWAAPFVVCDPATDNPDGYVLRIDGGAEITSPAQVVTGGKRLHYDVSGVTAGSHTMAIKAYKQDAVWGRLESSTVNFTFVRPAGVSAPVGIGLEP